MLILFALLVASLQLEDIFQMETATDPQISPDGSRIVYVRQFADIMTDRRYSNLWTIGFDGSGHRPLTTGKFRDTAPRWSPDGSQLVFTSDREGGTQLWRRWMDSGQMAKLTNATEALGTPAWSPDGKTIAFTMFVSEAGPKIVDLPKAPPGAKWAEPAKVYDTLVYRHDRAGYLKPGYTHLFTVPVEGGTPRQISAGKFHHGGGAWAASEPVWSADGKSIVMSANRHDNFMHDPRDTEIYEFQIADQTVRALTSRKGPDDTPAVSPDGTKIAFTGTETKYQGYELQRLSVMNRDGSGARTLTVTLDRDARDPRWAPDGKGLYFLADDEGNTGLYYSTLDGAVRKLVSHVGTGGFAVAKNGNIAATYRRPHVPGDIAVGTTSKPELKQITGVNDDLFAARKLGAVEEIWYESSKDKRRIQGWIIKPPDFDPGKKYPLILEIHGGPFANYGERFDLEKQLMAARGYVVLYTNPRGSTSYGQQFGSLIHHAYPGDDFFDLNAGVDAMLGKGYIDPKRLYVTGGSGGGVLTSWMIGRTTRFRAAVTVYPVINWYSFVLTSDIGNWTSKYWFPGLPWDHVDHYEKRSLLSVVKNVTTPTMVLVGEADYRTPISESEQYYQALQLRGIESVLVRVPDEPHGISVRPSHHISKIAHIVGWFDKHP